MMRNLWAALLEYYFCWSHKFDSSFQFHIEANNSCTKYADRVTMNI